jgi:multiple RNA-binding domain-containing protein 1
MHECLQAARAAFSGLAYKRFQHVPLYLEYAPRDIFTSSAASIREPPAPATDAALLQDSAPRPAGTPAVEQVTSNTLLDNTDDDAAEAASVYVKNVAFATSQETLRAVFDQGAAAIGGQLRAVRMVMGKRPDGRRVPKGFAFAEFDCRDTARAVLRALQGRTVDGHALQLELSTKKALAAGNAQVCTFSICKALTTQMSLRFDTCT